jgi:hypothetical protein
MIGHQVTFLNLAFLLRCRIFWYRTKILVGALTIDMEIIWDKPFIIHYAQENSWDGRVKTLVEKFQRIASKING